MDESFGRNETYSKLLYAYLATEMAALALFTAKQLSGCSAPAKAYFCGQPTTGWAVELYKDLRQTLPMNCVGCAERTERSTKNSLLLYSHIKRQYLPLGEYLEVCRLNV